MGQDGFGDFLWRRHRLPTFRGHTLLAPLTAEISKKRASKPKAVRGGELLMSLPRRLATRLPCGLLFLA